MVWSGTADPAIPSKLLTEAERCFYLRTSWEHPGDFWRVLAWGGQVVETRNVTWKAPPLQSSLLPQPQPTVESTPGGRGEACDEEPEEVWPFTEMRIFYVRLPPQRVEASHQPVGVESL